MKKNILIQTLLFVVVCGLVGCATNRPNENKSLFAQPSLTSSNISSHSSFWQSNPETIWDQLQHVSSARLASFEKTSDANVAAWIQLANISKQYSTNHEKLIPELLRWRERNPSHPGNTLFPDNNTLQDLLNAKRPQHIALLLPLYGTYGSSGQAVRDGFLNAYYPGMSKGKQNISFYDTSQTANLTELYQKAIAQGADYVVGPLLKEEVQKLRDYGSFPANTLALNYTNVYFGSLPTHFYEFGLLPEDEVEQIASRAAQAGRSRALVIAPQNAWGKRMVATFDTQWKSVGGTVQDSWYYGPQTNFNQDIANLLHVNIQQDKELMKKETNKAVLEQQRRQDFDVIFLFAQPQQGREIVPLLKFYYAGNVPIYATSTIYSGKSNPEKNIDLRGVIVCDIPSSTRVGNENSGRLYAVGQDAYLLSHELSRLAAIPLFPMYAKTGALTLSSKQQIHRRVPCSAIR
jgi:outer membrane PBP1 activator LpoA protein